MELGVDPDWKPPKLMPEDFGKGSDDRAVESREVRRIQPVGPSYDCDLL